MISKISILSKQHRKDSLYYASSAEYSMANNLDMVNQTNKQTTKPEDDFKRNPFNFTVVLKTKLIFCFFLSYTLNILLASVARDSAVLSAQNTIK